MRLRVSVILLALGLPAIGQRHKIEEINAEKPDGKLIQQIMQENDAGKKTALLEQFTSEYGESKDTPWALEQLQAAYVKAGETDKSITAGDRLLTLDPDAAEAGLQGLKAAESKKDAAMIRKYAVAAAAAAQRLSAVPQPKEAGEAANWKAVVEYAKQVQDYADYALYRGAAESRDPKATIDFGEALRRQSPSSEYAGKVADPLFVT